MSKAKMYGMPRKGIPNKRCCDKHWKQERNCKNGKKQDKYSAMARGAIQERVDYEVGKAVDNILDLNTDPCAKRKITLTIELKPDENRQYIKISASAKSTLAPVTPVGTTLGIAANPETGEMVLVESTPQVPGQVGMDGSIQEAPKLLKVAAMK